MKLLDRIRDVGVRRRLSPHTIACNQRWAHGFLLYCADRPSATPAAAVEVVEDDPYDIPLLDEPAGPAAAAGPTRRGGACR